VQGTITSMDLVQYWDEQAERFDDEPDHGLADPQVREAWARLLLPLMPPSASVADLGSGTGTLAVLLGQAGHRVSGLDIAPRMVDAARVKAASTGVDAEFIVGDAAAPPWAPGSFDVVLTRHVLWAMPDPDAALKRWLELLRPGGLLLLIEGRWSTGAGLTAEEVAELVLRHWAEATVRTLDDPAFWGGPITDERYLVASSS
jgi:SAM-dependent methyltransferase